AKQWRDRGARRLDSRSIRATARAADPGISAQSAADSCRESTAPSNRDIGRNPGASDLEDQSTAPLPAEAIPRNTRRPIRGVRDLDLRQTIQALVGEFVSDAQSDERAEGPHGRRLRRSASGRAVR